MMWWKDAAVKCSLTVMLQDMRLLRQLDSTGHMFHQICEATAFKLLNFHQTF